MSELNKLARLEIENKSFWNELCGTSLAREIGINDHSLNSLRRFDDAYLTFYPYLLRHVPVNYFSEKKVLEIGLGYGTLGQKIAESGGIYYGLDVANSPVKMMNLRLKMLELNGEVKQGSILQCPFPSSFFDVVVSIGCFHHTGDLRQSIKETSRVLKSGGLTFIMVYNKYSYRQWLRWPLHTGKALLAMAGSELSTISQRAAYDTIEKGEVPAPETVFTSIGELHELFRTNGFSSISIQKENCGGITLKGISLVSRAFLLNIIGKICGLDLYVKAIKS